MKRVFSAMNEQINFLGIPIVVSGPSGVGKGTVISHFMKQCDQIICSVSMTTRPPRPGEQEGVDYFYVSTEQFEDSIKNNELIEWAKVYGNYYGTPRMFLEQQFEQSRDVILDIDVQGAAAIRTLYSNGILVFIVPPSMEDLKQRLQNRAKGEGDNLDLRHKQSERELRFIDMYDYIIINDDPDRAAQDLYWIVKANRHRCHRIEPHLKSTGIFPVS